MVPGTQGLALKALKRVLTGDQETRRAGDQETRRAGDQETRKKEKTEIKPKKYLYHRKAYFS